MLIELIAARHDPGKLAKSQGRFLAMNGLIWGPNGQEFIAVGANLGTDNAFDWKGTASGHAADAVTWGWNCIRLNLLATDSISWSYLASHTLTQSLNYLDGIITQYTSLGIVVMLEAHDDPSSDGVRATVESKMVTFWTAAATKWKNNPYVWYNVINEPKHVNSRWVAIHLMLGRAVRAAGAKAPIVIDAPISGQDGGTDFDPTNLFGYDKTMAAAVHAELGNVILSLHAYGWFHMSVPDLTSYIHSVRAAGLTPFIGEFGYRWDEGVGGAYATNYPAALSVFTVASLLHVGISIWHGTHGDNYSVTANGSAFWNVVPGASTLSGTNFSDFGIKTWTFTHPLYVAPAS